MTAGDHQPAFAEHRKVAGNRRPAGMEPIGEIAGGFRSGAQQLQDLAPRLVRECLEERIRRCGWHLDN
jgi:hypothetical protein